MNIVLIGMRGSGKTTVGKLLAAKLKKDFVDTDQLLEKKSGMSIRHFVETYNWETFRNYEAEIIRELAKYNSSIIATGGGIVERQNNVKELKKKGVIIWLRIEIKSLLARIGEDNRRPFLSGTKSMAEDLKKILIKREGLYRKAANYIIKTDERAPSLIVIEIIKVYKNRLL